MWIVMEGIRIFTTLNSRIIFQLKLVKVPDKQGAAHHSYNTNIHFQESYWAEKCKHLFTNRSWKEIPFGAMKWSTNED